MLVPQACLHQASEQAPAFPRAEGQSIIRSPRWVRGTWSGAVALKEERWFRPGVDGAGGGGGRARPGGQGRQLCLPAAGSGAAVAARLPDLH